MAPDAQGSLEHATLPTSPDHALAVLPAPLALWFRKQFGKPTPAQCLAWPVLASGKDLLLCAPTGSGKTLAAFLPFLDRLVCAAPSNSVRCLYIAPSKALGNDVRKSLRSHLASFSADLSAAAGVRVGQRNGDTSTRCRRALWQEPPDILLTTPESLALLLSHPQAAELFRGLGWVVIDEIHALVSNKRGADLTLSLERLAALAFNKVQRVGLSATCRPLEDVARFLVGSCRPCTIALTEENAPLQLTVETLLDATGQSSGNGFLTLLLDRLEPELLANRTTLIFTNRRGLAERVAWALRRRYPEWVEQIGVHHSALAARLRKLVERRLKLGVLRVVVSSCSLELGIDIGTVDGVVLVHPPGGVVRLLQRVGRAGHGPGLTRRGLVLTANAAELLEAAVTAGSSRAVQAENLRLPSHPLDVLCQQLLGMASQGVWSAAEAFDLVRRAYLYRDLSQNDFDGCLAYLFGQRQDGSPWLPARLRGGRDLFTILNAATARLLRRNIGTIITEEPRSVRLSDGRAVGQVDEAFAERLNPGDRFVLDGRCLECRGNKRSTLLVDEVAGRPVIPRWSGEGWPLAPDLARRLYLFRVQAAEALREGPTCLESLLGHDYQLNSRATDELVKYFQSQESLSEIPDTHTCLVEVIADGYQGEYYVHTPLNRAANNALARVVVHRLARSRRRVVTSLVADLGFALFGEGTRDLTPEELVSSLSIQGFDSDFEEALTGSETLRERFRRVALTGFMLLRNPLSRRRVGGQDWAERRLFDQVRAAEPEFVLLRQALREVRNDYCDAEAARVYLEDFPSLTLRWRHLAQLSPFAEGWTQPEPGAAEGMEDPASALQCLHDSLMGKEPAHAGTW